MSEVIYIDVPKLIEDLRSGEFAQGTEYLHNVKNDSFCCLGVACERLTRLDLIPSMEDHLDPFFTATAYALNGKYESRELPPGIKFPIHTGIEGSFGRLPHPFTDRDGYLSDLADLNDGGMKFSQIADILQYLYNSR